MLYESDWFNWHLFYAFCLTIFSFRSSFFKKFSIFLRSSFPLTFQFSSVTHSSNSAYCFHYACVKTQACNGASFLQTPSLFQFKDIFILDGIVLLINFLHMYFPTFILELALFHMSFFYYYLK